MDPVVTLTLILDAAQATRLLRLLTEEPPAEALAAAPAAEKPRRGRKAKAPTDPIHPEAIAPQPAAQPAPEPAPAPAPTPEPAPAPAPLDIDAVRAAVKDSMDTIGVDATRAVFMKLGVARLGDLKPEGFAPFVAALRAAREMVS